MVVAQDFLVELNFSGLDLLKSSKIKHILCIFFRARGQD